MSRVGVAAVETDQRDARPPAKVAGCCGAATRVLVVRGTTVGQINDTRHYPVVEYQLGPSARRTRPDRKPQAGHWGGNPTPGGRVAALASEGNVIDRR